MDAIKLMNRMDTKYVFPQSQLPQLLEELKDNYKVLDVNGQRVSRYESLYFDTQNFDLYHNHHRGKTNRHKVRYRKYVESDLNFFEIKFKSNKGRTIKSRVKQEEIRNSIQDKAEKLLEKKTQLHSSELEPKFWVNYSRITLVNKHAPERVTIDVDLHFQKDDATRHMNDLVIAEVKQDRSGRSPFVKLMQKNHIRSGSVSKYCFGVLSFYKDIKQNNFKFNLRNINKIIHGTSASA
jgi:hypothetical protein